MSRVAYSRKGNLIFYIDGIEIGSYGYAIDYTKGQINISQVLTDFRSTILAINAPDEIKDEVQVAPFTISSDIGMGIETVKHAGKSLCVILKNHGAMAYGKSLDQALSAAVYLEETCDVYMTALATGKEITVLTRKQIEEEDAPRGYYGQY